MGKTAQQRRNRRLYIWTRDNGICWLCRAEVSLESFTVDHVVPKAHGGTGALRNLRAAHKECNVKRGSPMVRETGIGMKLEFDHERYRALSPASQARHRPDGFARYDAGGGDRQDQPQRRTATAPASLSGRAADGLGLGAAEHARADAAQARPGQGGGTASLHAAAYAGEKA